MDEKEELIKKQRKRVMLWVIGFLALGIVAIGFHQLTGQQVGGKVLLPPNLTQTELNNTYSAPISTTTGAPVNFTGPPTNSSIAINYYSHHPSHWTGLNVTYQCANLTVYVEYAEPTLDFSWWTNAIIYNSSIVGYPGHRCIFKNVSGNVR